MSWLHQDSLVTLPNMNNFRLASGTHQQDEKLATHPQFAGPNSLLPKDFFNVSSSILPSLVSSTATTPVPFDTHQSAFEMSKLLPNNLWNDDSATAPNTHMRSNTPLTSVSNPGFSSSFSLLNHQQQPLVQQPQTIGLTLEQQQILIQQQFLLQQQLQQQQNLLQNIQPLLAAAALGSPSSSPSTHPQQPLTEENLSLFSSPPNSNHVASSQQQHSSQQTKSNSSQTNINQELYKTELCQQYMKKQSCPYGAKCQFAHGVEELKYVKRPSNWKTKSCANWSKFGECRYGRRCCFKHGEN